MKCICVFLVVAVSNTLASLPAPEISLEETNSGWKVVWKPVHIDAHDPILGYKIRVNIYIKNDQYHIVDNPDEPFFQQELLVTNEENELKVDLQPNIPYEFTVLAFTRNEDGPLSAPQRITVSED